MGRDPDAYAAITSAQQSYTPLTVDGVFYEETRSRVSLEQMVGGAVAPGDVTAGIMSDARTDAVHGHNTAAVRSGERNGMSSSRPEAGTVGHRMPMP
ncbi:hypothetical protein ACGRHY_20935 [Streptomyces sp. HK10]|uniref:hypothetical protein n=1 Tax=Streptomyces sp. HK10 TaxID=3373255 RepID=UPI003748A0D0